MLIAVVLVLALGQAPLQPGDLLTDGLQLSYRSNGTDQPAWVVDSVRPDPAPPADGRCVRVFLRRNPNQPRAEDTRTCVVRDTLVTWSSSRGVWVPQRPVAPGMLMVLPRANGDTVSYSTEAWATETISDRPIRVLVTTVLTVDSAGRPKRRLRERYAPGLVTATGGVFEEPDGTGGWREVQRFELAWLRRP